MLLETFLPGRDLWEWTPPPSSWVAPVIGGLGQARLAIIDRRVVFGRLSLDLAARPHMLSLFRAFMMKPGDTELDRDGLVLGVYGVGAAGVRSPRFLESRRANCVKLVSRARFEAEQALSGEHTDQLEWFPYDPGSRSWRLLAWRSRPQARSAGAGRRLN